ncbi:MAG: diguanylate cyclase [bacterium]|nr:diguanylate cyclase [bacterium]
MKPNVLLVEENHRFASSIIKRIENELGRHTFWARNYTEAQNELNRKNDYGIALLDMTLPDAPMGKAVDLVKSYNIPPVAIAPNFSDEIQEFIWTKKVVDYVVKEGPHALDYLVNLVERIERNKRSKILVVDDSGTARAHIKKLLKIHQYQVLEAANGKEALKILGKNNDIMLVLTDYKMPEIDGIELTRKIREHFSMDRLGIIGLSSEGNHQLSVKFIKHGANDFISKPFLSEQLYCRVEQNIRTIDRFESLRHVSLTDHLTKLKNRRYFFEFASVMYKNCLRKGTIPVIAMVDIDHFKNINDTFGHKTGDEVLSTLGATMKESFRETDIVSRYGGEEFCIMAINMNVHYIAKIFNTLRKKIEQTKFKSGKSSFSVTISIGICNNFQNSLAGMIQEADRKLYRAKKTGRNRIVF